MIAGTRARAQFNAKRNRHPPKDAKDYEELKMLLPILGLQPIQRPLKRQPRRIASKRERGCEWKTPSQPALQIPVVQLPVEIAFGLRLTGRV